MATDARPSTSSGLVVDAREAMAFLADAAAPDWFSEESDSLYQPSFDDDSGVRDSAVEWIVMDSQTQSATSLSLSESGGLSSASTSTSRPASRLTCGEESVLSLDDEDDVSSINSDEVDELFDEVVKSGQDIPPTLDNALTLNELCQEKVLNMMQEVEETLQANLERQQVIANQLENLHKNQALAMKEMSENSGAKRSMAVFCHPYFKDVRGFSHPPNEDTLKKRDRHELDVYFCHPRKWTTAEKEQLVKAVREEAIRERLKQTVNATEALLAAGKKEGVTAETKTAIMARLKELKKQGEDVKNTKDEVLFHNRAEDFDWMRISAQTVS